MATKAKGESLDWGFMYEDELEYDDDHFILFLLVDRCRYNPISYALEIAVLGEAPLYCLSVTLVDNETHLPVVRYEYKMFDDLETALFEYDYMLMLRQLKVKSD